MLGLEHRLDSQEKQYLLSSLVPLILSYVMLKKALITLRSKNGKKRKK